MIIRIISNKLDYSCAQITHWTIRIISNKLDYSCAQITHWTTDQFLEMPNIDKQRKENPEYKVDDYEEVGPGRENKGASITNNEHASGKCQANNVFFTKSAL